MSNKLNHSMSLAKPDALDITTKQKVALAIGVIGLFILTLALFNTNFPNEGLFLTVALGLITVGITIYSREAYLTKLEGIKNDGVWFKSISSRGVWGWIVGVILVCTYVGLSLANVFGTADPVRVTVVKSERRSWTMTVSASERCARPRMLASV